jgi:hypothetical protein
LSAALPPVIAQTDIPELLDQALAQLERGLSL